jgi:mycothiol synthase
LDVDILPFSPAHYTVYTALWNDAYPDLRRTELEMRLTDLSLASEPPKKAACGRWVAEHKGVAVACGGYQHFDGELFHPDKFQLHLMVSPEYRRRGIGAMLFDRVLVALRMSKAVAVRAWIRHDRVESLKFLAARGFVEEMRTFHSSLDVPSFDLTRLGKYVRRLGKYDYELRAFGELESNHDRNRRLYDLYCELMQEIPSPEPPNLPSFEEYERRIAESPQYFRCHFVALRRGEYVGLCILLQRGRTRDELYADTLGVKGSCRGRGIAQGLSYKGIEYAKSKGFSRISADNSVENHRIQALLENLGFANRSVWSLYSKELPPGP